MPGFDTDHEFMNAYTFGFCEKRAFTKGTVWRWSLEEMVKTTGCNAIILPVCAWQEHTYSTEVISDSPDVMSEEDVAAVCGLAKQLHLKVILKAMVNCRDGYWRAYIRFFDSCVPTEPGWADWFPSWTAHVCRVADMARENQADMLCVGCEMVGTDHRAQEWRKLIQDVRGHYDGPITYNCDKYQEDLLTWWDAVDVISSSGYYPIDDLSRNFERIKRVAEHLSKPFMFMECGCPSRQNSEYRPNDWTYGRQTDMCAQQAWYQAFTACIMDFPFVRGTGWWDWPATRLYPKEAAFDHSGYCTYGKPANEILQSFSKLITKN